MTTGVLSGPALAAELDGLLRGLVELYGGLETCLKDHEHAIRVADAKGIQRAVETQRPLWGRAAELERQRKEIAARAVSGRPELMKAYGTDIRLSTLAGLTSEAPRLVAMAERVRQMIDAVHQRVQVVRRATESLLNHMEGIARQVCGTLNHAKTYGRRGRVEAGPSVVSALDLRS
ncbi:MAG: flagellar export chaperone FlgN [Phycisphaerales bacterium]